MRRVVSTQDFGRALDRLRPVVGAVTRAHIALYRRTGGRLGHTAPGLPTMLLLDHVGAFESEAIRLASIRPDYRRGKQCALQC